MRYVFVTLSVYIKLNVLIVGVVFVVDVVVVRKLLDFSVGARRVGNTLGCSGPGFCHGYEHALRVRDNNLNINGGLTHFPGL